MHSFIRFVSLCMCHCAGNRSGSKAGWRRWQQQCLTTHTQTQQSNDYEIFSSLSFFNSSWNKSLMFTWNGDERVTNDLTKSQKEMKKNASSMKQLTRIDSIWCLTSIPNQDERRRSENNETSEWNSVDFYLCGVCHRQRAWNSWEHEMHWFFSFSCWIPFCDKLSILSHIRFDFFLIF